MSTSTAYSGERERRRPGRQSKILLVDDNARNMSILTKILGKEYQLASARSGEEALEIARAFQPDLVLLDIMMPGIDGYETCQRFRANPRFRWAKIIMVSARAMTAERLRGYESGADDYLTKPFDEDELLAKVRVHLRLRFVEEVDQLKTEVLALLSHETRTPLHALIGPSEILATDESLSAAERKQWAETIRKGALRLQRLFDRVLTLAALKGGQMPIAPEPVAPWELIRDAITAVAAQAEEKQVTFKESPPIAAVPMLDRKLMTSVLVDILDNAIRFSPPRGCIRVDVSGDEEAIRVAVTDEGPGIPADLVPRAFEEFTSADAERHSDGQGLSLAIARQIVLAHEGDIAVESSVGGGTTFTFSVPCGTPAVARAPAAKSA